MLRGTLGDYWIILHRKKPALLFSAGFISSLGSTLTGVAVPLAAYEMTGSMGALAGVWLLRIVASVVALPISGVMADRYNRKGIFNNMLSIFADVIMAVAVWISRLEVLLAGVVLLQVAERFYSPAARAAFPHFFSRDELAVANSLRVASTRLVDRAGPAMGGVLAASLGVTALFVIDAASFLVAALLIALIDFGREHLAQPVDIGAVLSQMREGLQQAVGSLPVLVYLAAGVVGAFCARLFDIIGVYITQDVLNTGPEGLGLLYSFLALGSLVAALLVPRLRLDRADFRLYGLLQVVSAGLMLVFATARSAPVAYASVALRYGADTVGGVMIDTEVQKVIQAQHLGRVTSVIFLSFTLGSVLGVAVSSGLGKEYATVSFAAGAVLTACLGLWVVRVYGSRPRTRYPLGQA
ncbi:MAG: MFS transporter [Bacillota bacterium]|nr:MFS transporter [Bacillota bacterium]